MGALVSAGCGREEITVYSTPKEPRPAPPAGHHHPPHDHPETSPASATPQLRWVTPSNWKEVPPGDFRAASFRVKGADNQEADVSVIPLPGEAGGDLSNVNRWRGQVNQQPVTEEELAKIAEPVQIAGTTAALYDQAGEGATGNPTRILAVIQRQQGTTWFYKMTGDDKLVAEQKPAFVAFLKSLEFSTSAPAGAPPSPTPVSANPGKPRWQPPAGWQEAPGGQFLTAKFVIKEGDGSAAVNISTAPGDGGGLVPNVNRWRQQLGLAEASAEEIMRSARVEGEAIFVELTGKDPRTGNPTALVAAVILQPSHAWFYKLMGDDPVVAGQRTAFKEFVQGVKY